MEWKCFTHCKSNERFRHFSFSCQKIICPIVVDTCRRPDRWSMYSGTGFSRTRISLFRCSRFYWSGLAGWCRYVHRSWCVYVSGIGNGNVPYSWLLQNYADMDTNLRKRRFQVFFYLRYPHAYPLSSSVDSAAPLFLVFWILSYPAVSHCPSAGKRDERRYNVVLLVEW